MSTFRYEAINAQGQSVKGAISANSLASAKEHLRALGYLPTSIKKQQSLGFSFQFISNQDLALLTRQLSTLLGASIPLEEALLSVIEQTEKPKVKDMLTGIRNKVLEGYSFAQSLEDYDALFPELYRTTVGAGEQSGELDLILQSLAEYTERQQALRQKVQHALIYPIIMMLVSVSIIIFLLTFVVPTMIQVFSDSGQTLPLSTHILIMCSDFIQSWGLMVLATLIGTGIVAHYLLKEPKRKYRFHSFLLKVPVISYLIKTVNVARYIHTFSILFSAGVNVLETMRIGSKLIQNLPMKQAFQNATYQVREGRDISQALKETGFLPPMAVYLIASGEKSGELANMMKHAALHLEKEVGQLIDTALALLEPLMIILMGGVVLFIVLATLLPIFSMEQLVG